MSAPGATTAPRRARSGPGGEAPDRSEALLDAGAIRPGRPERDRSVDDVTARRYRHPALEDRVVVRLVPATLGEAEDLSMEFLGFAAAGAAVPVGHGRRQALGFPAWALVHDPANGRHALALVKDMERLARLARTKPGNAKLGYDALAARLDATAPHFLPTFWEEAGRAFLAAENAKAAGTCFATARQAEQVHSLTVDEERLRDAHLEFAFGGALTAKALSDYARQVAARRPAAEAYQLVRAIAVRRVAGGLPPYAAMADDLKRLARAAGLDPAAEAESVAAELLAYPAVTRAHEGFWKSYRTAVARLARREPEIRGRLLGLLLDPPGYDTDLTEEWLGLLDEAGALDALRDPDAVPPAARPAGGAAGWVQRFLDHRYRGWARRRRHPRWLDLLVELTGRLRAELVDRGEALRVCARFPSRTDLDALDICLALGVPVADPPPLEHRRQGQFDVGLWTAGPDQGRTQLAAVAADERFQAWLVAGVRAMLGAGGAGISQLRRPAAARGEGWRLEAAGLRAAAAVWLAELAGRTGREPTVQALADALDEVAPLWSVSGVGLAPGAFTQLSTVDLHRSLARSLRGGFLAELGWPEYEWAYAELAPGPRFNESWPDLVLSTQQRAIVVGPAGHVLDHTLRVPPGVAGPEGVGVSYVDGQLWVSWRDAGYWSGRPAEVIQRGDAHWPEHGVEHFVSLARPDGGRTTGARPWRAGDTAVPARTHIASDGVSYWRLDRAGRDSETHHRWREYDPVTGAAGRLSQPAFLDVDGPDRPEAWWSWLHPAPARYAGSPLGWRDGMVGWRVARHPDGSYTGTGIDGRRVTWRPVGSHFGPLVGAVRLPGDDRPRPVTGGTSRTAVGLAGATLWDAGGRGDDDEGPAGDDRAGQPAHPQPPHPQPVSHQPVGAHLPPVILWHALRPRDEPGSLALRATDAGLAARLLAECTDAAEADLTGAARVAVSAALPEVTDPVLGEAVAEAVAQAERVRRLQVSLRDLMTAPAPSGVETDPKVPPDPRVAAATSDLLGRLPDYRPGRSAGVTHQIRAVATLLTATPGSTPTASGDRDEVPTAEASWLEAVGGLGALVVRAASPVTSDTDRDAIVALLSSLTALGLAGTDPRARLVDLVAPSGVSIMDDGLVRRTATSTIVLVETGVTDADRARMTARGIEFSPTGQFAVPEPLTLREEIPLTGWGDPDRLAAVVAALRERGPMPWPAAAPDQLAAATGMARGEAALLLAGLPGVSGWAATFLTPQQRHLLGVSAAEARTARDGLRAIPRRRRLALLDAAMPADPVDLWRRGPDVAALAQRWTELFGRTDRLSDDLLIEAARMLPGHDGGEIVRTIANPQPGDWLHTDGEAVTRPHGIEMVARRGGSMFTGAHLSRVAVALPWLAYRLPGGDPVRRRLPAVYRLVRERLRNDGLIVGHAYVAPDALPDDLPALVRHPTGAAWTVIRLAPARLSGVDDPALSFVDHDIAACLRLLLSDRYAEVVTGIEHDPTPAGRFPHDPTVSVPDLVNEAGAAYDLDPAAAAYYLQLLALPDPADRRVTGWNGWSPAHLRTVKATLAATDLVVEARRERAGRSLFLPGGWLSRRAPDLPLEAWKAGLGMGAHDELPGRRILVTEAVPDLFRRAWRRVADGDRPRYSSLSEDR